MTGPGPASESGSRPAGWSERRSKSIAWHDPHQALAEGRNMSGREYLQAMTDGRLPFPPIGSLLNFRGVEVGEGEVLFSCTPDESVFNPMGGVHGGLACTLLDSVVGCAALTLLPAGSGFTSIELKVSFLRPVPIDRGDLLARGWVTKLGQRVAFAAGEVTDQQGSVLAAATSSLLILHAAPA